MTKHQEDRDRLTEIAVIMSTYNGAAYIRSQLDSILAQRGVKVTLYIRDDGSRDETPDILREYSERYSNVIFWNQNNRENMGVTRSFLHLLKEVIAKDSQSLFFAFADQDDVWLEDKLAVALEEVLAATPDRQKPSLYYSNKTFVDESLKLIREESIRNYGDFFEVLESPFAFGCTMLFNRTMAEYAVRVMPLFSYHDAWLFRLAKSCDAAVVFGSKSYILYRQHGDNVSKMTPLMRAKLAVAKMRKKREHALQNLLREIYDNYADVLGREARRYIELVLSYNRNPVSWIRLAFDPHAFQRGPVNYGIWLGKLVFHIL